MVAEQESNNNEIILSYGHLFAYIMCGCVALSGIGSFVAYDRTKKKLRTPPGPIPQYINKFLHTEPFSFIFYGIFWSGVLIIVYPVVGILLLIISMLKVIKYLHSPKAKVVDAKNGDKELAVYITGCDSGFGKDLAFALYDKGFIVFPGCLSEDGMKQFEGEQNMENTEIVIHVFISPLLK